MHYNVAFDCTRVRSKHPAAQQHESARKVWHSHHACLSSSMLKSNMRTISYDYAIIAVFVWTIHKIGSQFHPRGIGTT